MGVSLGVGNDGGAVGYAGVGHFADIASQGTAELDAGWNATDTDSYAFVSGVIQISGNAYSPASYIPTDNNSYAFESVIHTDDPWSYSCTGDADPSTGFGWAHYEGSVSWDVTLDDEFEFTGGNINSSGGELEVYVTLDADATCTGLVSGDPEGSEPCSAIGNGSGSASGSITATIAYSSN
jgi:hypothetical protein